VFGFECQQTAHNLLSQFRAVPVPIAHDKDTHVQIVASGDTRTKPTNDRCRPFCSTAIVIRTNAYDLTFARSERRMRKMVGRRGEMRNHHKSTTKMRHG